MRVCYFGSEYLITSYLHHISSFYFERGWKGIVTGTGIGFKTGSVMGIKFEINGNGRE